MSQPLHEFTSHIAGKNATVRVFPDRIEWETVGKARIGMAVATLGASTLSSNLRRKGAGSEMMPIRAVTSVTTKKGLRNTALTIISAGNTIEANISHAEAEQVKATILRLMSQA